MIDPDLQIGFEGWDAFLDWFLDYMEIAKPIVEMTCSKCDKPQPIEWYSAAVEGPSFHVEFRLRACLCDIKVMVQL